MAQVHVLKLTQQEAVVKCYLTESAGGSIEIDLATDLKLSTETFSANIAEVTISEIFWGCKKDKQIDLSRIDDPVANTVHGHYYLLNSGHYKFDGFVDSVYANSNIRITGDGPFHTILKLRKKAGYQE